MRKNTGKAEVLEAFFALIFTGKICLQESQSPETTGKAWSKEDLSLVEEAQVRGHLNCTYASRWDLMGTHP